MALNSWLAFPVVFLALSLSPARADEPAGSEPKKVVSEGWAIPAGHEARFAEDERDCAKQAVAVRGRRMDARKWENCMAERGWKRR